jgi:HAD superfamily hydrolase (TIGR01509 family)
MVVIFDWDGTLHDSKYAAIQSWIHAGKILGMKIVKEDILDCTGLDLKGISQFLGFPEEEQEEAMNIAVNFFKKEVRNKHYLFPDVKETLEKLKPIHKIAIYTNGVTWVVNDLIDKYKIRDYFDIIITSETAMKPSPEGIDIILNELGEKTGFMIDDAPEGIIAAKKAGIPSIGALYGMNPQRLLLSNPTAVINKVAEVPFMIKSL